MFFVFFSSDPAVSSSIFVGAEREELIRNDPDKSEFRINGSVGKLGRIPEEGPSFRVETLCSIKRLLEDEELCC